MPQHPIAGPQYAHTENIRRYLRVFNGCLGWPKDITVLLIVVLIQQLSKKARVAVAHCTYCRLEKRLVFYVVYSFTDVRDVRNVISNS